MKWITAGDIKNWSISDPVDCMSLLPELIRRLIHASGSGHIKLIDFPSGSGIFNSGWDGKLETNNSSPYYPKGISGWEIGIESSPTKKANKDYIKRTSKPLGLNCKKSVFIFVTPRQWSGMDKWVNEKKKEGKWLDVSAIDANLLEQWLEKAPAVSLWLACHLKKATQKMKGIEDFWSKWSASTQPNMSPDMVIAGRESNMQEIHNWLSGPPAIFSLLGDSPDEPFAFLYSSTTKLPEAEKESIFSRCVIVNSSEEIDTLISTFTDPLIIIAPGECNDMAGLALNKGHHVFLAASGNLLKRNGTYFLGRPKIGKIKQAMIDQGMSELQASKEAKDSGRSIPVIRRRLAVSTLITRPQWGNLDSAKILLPILFVGAWQENKEGDRQIVETLSGKKYQDYLAELQTLLTIDDSPVRKIGEVWMLKSPLDAWFVLAQFLTKDMIDNYLKVLTETFSTADPKFELDPDKRWAAAVYGKSNKFSSWLQTGLTESLVLMSVYGDEAKNISSINLLIDKSVLDLLSSSKDWRVWASLDSFLPHFAEASPESFVTELDKIVKSDKSLFISLLQDDGSMFGDSKHTGLLWALEALAWSPVYFSRTCDILFSLAQIDPGGRYHPRPAGILTDIFRAKWPQTNASPDDRETVLNKFSTLDPKLLWNFTKQYFEDGITVDSYRFRWRDDGGTRTSSDPEKDPDVYLKKLISKLEELVCIRANIIDGIGEFTRLPTSFQEKIICNLEKGIKFTNTEGLLVFEKIRGLMNRISTYEKGTLNRYMPRLGKLLKKYSPKDILDRVGWLLSNPWPDLPYSDKRNHSQNESLTEKARNKATREVVDSISPAKIVKFASKIAYVGIFGKSLGSVVKDGEEDKQIFSAIISLSKTRPEIISSYSQARIAKKGTIWINKQISNLKKSHQYTPDIHALMLKGLPENKTTWLLVEREGEKVDLAYWKHNPGYCPSDDNSDIQFAVEKVLKAKMPKSALEIAGGHKVSLPSELLKRVILELLSIPGKLIADTMTSFYVANILNQLYERKELSDEEIAKLEIPFALLFEDIETQTHKQFAVHRVIETNPDYFADLVAMIYKRDDGKPEPLNPKGSEIVAKKALAILDSWHTLPGRDTDGSINEKKLSDWIKTARTKCAKHHHSKPGDLWIGSMLAHSPYDTDGAWPHKTIRNIIEGLNNDLINKHIPTEIYNSRGVVSRGLDEGGNQERKLSTNYGDMAQKIRTKWPVTASILDHLSKSYEYDAKREDIDADLHDIRWG